jgi:hypothetical protein
MTGSRTGLCVAVMVLTVLMTAGLSRDGTTGSAVLAALDRAIRPKPRSTTPTGQFTVLRQADGYDRGCVRVSDAAIDWLWTTNALPLGQPVWVYR